MERKSPSRILWSLAVLTAAVIGPACGPPVAVDKAPFLPRGEAIARVNRNSSVALGKRLRIKGRWEGTFGKEGGWHKGGLKMDVALPNHLRFMDSGDGLIAKRFQVGCTSETAWFWQTYPDDQDHMRIATRQNAHLLTDRDVPIVPLDLIDCLGLAVNSTGEPAVLFRVAEDHNQFLHARADDLGQQYLARETWVSRRFPDRIERVLFRDPEGRIVLDARLSDHRLVPESSLTMAHVIDIQMPTAKSALELRIRTVSIKELANHDLFRDPQLRAQQDPSMIPPQRVCWIGDPPLGRQSHRCSE